MLHAVKGLESWRVIDCELGPWPGVHQCCLLVAGIRAFFNEIYEHKKTLLVNSLDTSQRLDSPTFVNTDLTFCSTILCFLLWASLELSFFLCILLHSVNASSGHLLLHIITYLFYFYSVYCFYVSQPNNQFVGI